uniref:Uncharacterized protein n=1 Tax=Rhizophora mucronata TaxID=61149 RepID=A0A2P2NUE1_RHIMU
MWNCCESLAMCFSNHLRYQG